MSKFDHILEPRTSVRRVEVITESGRRRRFSAGDKARFVEETLAPGAARIVAATAVYVAPSNATAGCDPCGSRAADVRARCRAPSCTPPERSPRQRRRLRNTLGTENSGIIELEINGVAVRVGRGADAATIAAVIHALKTCT